MSDERVYVVEVYGFGEQEFRAANRNQARYRAFLAFRNAWPDSFREFLARGVSVRDGGGSR